MALPPSSNLSRERSHSNALDIFVSLNISILIFLTKLSIARIAVEGKILCKKDRPILGCGRSKNLVR